MEFTATYDSVASETVEAGAVEAAFSVVAYRIHATDAQGAFVDV